MGASRVEQGGAGAAKGCLPTSEAARRSRLALLGGVGPCKAHTLFLKRPRLLSTLLARPRAPGARVHDCSQLWRPRWHASLYASSTVLHEGHGRTVPSSARPRK